MDHEQRGHYNFIRPEHRDRCFVTDSVESWTLVKNFNAGTLRTAAINGRYGYAGTQTEGVFVRQTPRLYLPLVMR